MIVRWRAEPGRRDLRRVVPIGVLLAVALGLHAPAGALVLAPLVLAWAAARADRPPALRASARLEPAQVIEGDTAAVAVELDGDPALIEVGVVTPSAPAPQEGASALRLPVTPARWGITPVGPVLLRHRAPGGAVWTAEIGIAAGGAEPARRATLRVHPAPAALGALPAPASVTHSPGTHRSRHAQRGIELAEVRPLAPGDPVRDVNWHVSARRGALWVSQRQPDRRADVVLLLDTFDAGTLDDAVRLAAALADALLARHDRVGVVGFGGVLRWLAPGAGEAHRVRIADALISSQAIVSAAWKDLRLVPARTLPAHAQVVVVSPLAEQRTLNAIADLLARRRDVVVIDVADRVRRAPRGPLVARLDMLAREAERSRLRRLGARVGAWEAGEAAGAALARLAPAPARLPT